MSRARALIEETVAAIVALAVLGAAIALIYWYASGESPWPVLALVEAIVFGWGLVLLIATSPAWRR